MNEVIQEIEDVVVEGVFTFDEEGNAVLVEGEAEAEVEGDEPSDQ
jgi:hypothetical protein